MDVFQLFKQVFADLIHMFDAVPMFGTTAWRIMVGLMAVSVVVWAVRLLFRGGSGGDKE